MKAPTVVLSKGPEGVVALTRYRGLQFSSSYLGQEESLPHVIGEGKKRLIRRSSDCLGHRTCRTQLRTDYAGVIGRFPDGIHQTVRSSIDTCVTTIVCTFPNLCPPQTYECDTIHWSCVGC